MEPDKIAKFLLDNWIWLLVTIIIVSPIMWIILHFLFKNRLEEKTARIEKLENELKEFSEAETIENKNNNQIMNETTQPKIEEDEACKVLKSLQLKMHKADGSYIINDSTYENKKTAAHLFNQLHGKIIGTSFFEDPTLFKDDLASLINSGSKFYRIVTEDICPISSQEKEIELFKKLECEAKLVVIDNKKEITKIGGIFSKLNDKSYLAFIALNNAQIKNNQGLIFVGDIAKELYEYYYHFVKK